MSLLLVTMVIMTMIAVTKVTATKGVMTTVTAIKGTVAMVTMSLCTVWYNKALVWTKTTLNSHLTSTSTRSGPRLEWKQKIHNFDGTTFKEIFITYTCISEKADQSTFTDTRLFSQNHNLLGILMKLL